jgi:transposase-like protein
MGRPPFAKKRRTPEFKVEAVRTMRERLAAGLTLQRASEELEVGPDQLRHWANQIRRRARPRLRFSRVMGNCAGLARRPS